MIVYWLVRLKNTGLDLDVNVHCNWCALSADSVAHHMFGVNKDRLCILCQIVVHIHCGDINMKLSSAIL
jgi:hypothetical protein